MRTTQQYFYYTLFCCLLLQACARPIAIGTPTQVATPAQVAALTNSLASNTTITLSPDLIYYLEETLVSVISLFIDGDDAQFRKFATLADQQGKGLGSALLEHLIKEAQSRGVRRLWCNARVDKTGFYERFGMTTTDHTFSKGGIDYVIMEVFL